MKTKRVYTISIIQI